MEAENIVEAFNNVIKSYRDKNEYNKASGRCIVHRQILPHKTIKSLLDIFITVYFVTSTSKEELIKVRQRLPANVNVNEAMVEATEKMTFELMSMIGTHTFNQLVADTYINSNNTEEVAFK